MSTNLYYTPSDDRMLPIVGQQQLYQVLNGTALEMLYRINVGGKSISPNEDTGMFRSWSPDDKYLTEDTSSVLVVNTTIELLFTKIPPYTAPEDVYRTARTTGIKMSQNIIKSYNLTWEFPVDSRFNYLVRLHFCEIQSKIFKAGDRAFLIFIANQTAETKFDMITLSGEQGIPVYVDYAVLMFDKDGEKKMNLSIAL